MKRSIIMLAYIITLILTWMFVGGIVYCTTDIPTYKECLISGGVGLLMLIIGWIPAVVVGFDISDYLDKK
jgi:hypothetical protein